MLKIPGVSLMVVISLAASIASGADDADELLAYLDREAATYDALAQDIWGLAELGYLETESSRKLQARLQQEGFEIRSGVADIPTAFVASYGEGAPVVVLLAEFDALPGISQAAAPIR